MGSCSASKPRARFTQIAIVLLAWCLGATACSSSFEFSVDGASATEVAVGLIESDGFAQRLGLPSITDATCDEPQPEEIGATFACTASSNGQTVKLEAQIEGEDRLFAEPTNVVQGREVVEFARSAVQALNLQLGTLFAEDAMDCGSESVILGDDNQMMCTVTGLDGVVYGAALTVRDVNLGTFDVEVLDPVE